MERECPTIVPSRKFMITGNRDKAPDFVAMLRGLLRIFRNPGLPID